ncbi:MAG TPA: hypothetical protein DG761_07845, partial [Gammaproteobacteria bacterium]|nr:hypothetical protein [Gammaproteobacteria bacterium]
EAADRANTIAGHQEAIIDTASGIRSELHGVEDKTPWWARMLSQLAIAGAIIGIVILLWQTGIGSLIKRIVWALGWFIPARAMRSAEMDMKSINKDTEMSYREAVAVRRSSDPAYEAARKKLKRRTG